jgi:hypothetical protein
MFIPMPYRMARTPSVLGVVLLSVTILIAVLYIQSSNIFPFLEHFQATSVTAVPPNPSPVPGAVVPVAGGLVPIPGGPITVVSSAISSTVTIIIIVLFLLVFLAVTLIGSVTQARSQMTPYGLASSYLYSQATPRRNNARPNNGRGSSNQGSSNLGSSNQGSSNQAPS